MRYVHETLLKGEEIYFITRPHWIVFGPSAALLVVTLWFYIYGVSFNLQSFTFYNMSLNQTISLVLFIVFLITLSRAFLLYRFSEYAITNKRVIMKTGWLDRSSLEIFLEKIEAIYVDQTITGRILNYGTLNIVGTGGSRDPFTNVPKPLLFRRLVQQKINDQETEQRKPQDHS